VKSKPSVKGYLKEVKSLIGEKKFEEALKVSTKALKLAQKKKSSAKNTASQAQCYLYIGFLSFN